MAFLGRSDEVLTVGEFTRRFKMLLKTSIPELWISGEVSNLRVNSSGHSYFTLKDADASISAVLFRGDARSVSFPLRDGAKIFAFGEISIYEPKGTYQIIVRAAIPDGSGDLAARFEALKEKLSKEGLFDKSSKKKIPAMPKNVAVITSPTGAAMRDFHRILKRRGWRGNIWVLPARVQGAEAAAEIASQIEFAKNFRFEDGSDGINWVSLPSAEAPAEAQQAPETLAPEAEAGAAPEAPVQSDTPAAEPEEAEYVTPQQVTDRLLEGGFDPEIARQVTAIFADCSSYRVAYNRLRSVFGNNTGREYYPRAKEILGAPAE